MKIAIIGYQSSGKSTLFEWLTGVASDPAQAHISQGAMARVEDARFDQLCKMYQPKKVTLSALEIVDTPGLDRSGSGAQLAQFRDAGCLVFVIAAFDSEDPLAVSTSLEDDLLLADLDILSGRMSRLAEAVRKPRPDRDQMREEMEIIQPLVETLEQGQPLRHATMTDQQVKLTRAFQLLTQKPRLVVVNVADDEEHSQRLAGSIPGDVASIAVPVRLEADLAKQDPDQRQQFLHDMGLEGCDRQKLIQSLVEVAGLLRMFTVGPNEVRCWLLRGGSTAVDAAGAIHSDLARGFIRAETIAAKDLVSCGSEREAKAKGLVRQEPKDYIVQDGDVVLFRFSV